MNYHQGMLPLTSFIEPTGFNMGQHNQSPTPTQIFTRQNTLAMRRQAQNSLNHPTTTLADRKEVA